MLPTDLNFVNKAITGADVSLLVIEQHVYWLPLEVLLYADGQVVPILTIEGVSVLTLRLHHSLEKVADLLSSHVVRAAPLQFIDGLSVGLWELAWHCENVGIFV